jgi:hypothetical protein
MKKNIFGLVTGVLAIVVIGGCNNTQVAQKNNDAAKPMSFFVTSKNPGSGANLGGLAGADAYCQSLAASVGAGDLNWKAYLSATATESTPAVNARDRIGQGPWYNAKGVLIAENVAMLHSNNAINKENALSEKGEQISGRGDAVNLHDILTGSMPDGTASAVEGDTTCKNWTSGTEGAALVGHHDRKGLDEGDAAKSWNSSHASRGCSLENLKGTGGGGLFYCFGS